jgi:hypothetical protein
VNQGISAAIRARRQVLRAELAPLEVPFFSEIGIVKE